MGANHLPRKLSDLRQRLTSNEPPKARPEILQSAPPQSHLVQFYGSDDALINRNTACFLAEGLTVGGALVIGSRERNRAVALELKCFGIDSSRAETEGRLCFLDAEDTLAKFMINNEPYWGRFQETIGSPIAKIRGVVGHDGLRAYGEMVGVLWTKGLYAAAVRLEYFWNRLLTRSSASLLCGYPIELSSQALEKGPVDAVLCAHTHLVHHSALESLDRAPRVVPIDEIPAQVTHDLRPTSVRMGGPIQQR